MRVLFVSKPVVPPFDDGSKCLVRDVATALRVAEPVVMVSPGAPPLGVRTEPVYGAASRFASDHALVFHRLLFGAACDVWHFVFAPNTASSAAAHLAIRARRSRGWAGKVVQTVASRPHVFTRPLFFGDRIVALSAWARAELIAAGLTEREVVVIPPCARAPVVRTPRHEVRARLGVGEGPLVVYPGDLHVSSGAMTLAHAIPEVLRAVPGVRFVYACRAKGADTVRQEQELAAALAGLEEFVRFVGHVDDMHALLAAADVVAFPVDDLYGKVDLPIVLLEAMALSVPVVVASGGPLEELPARKVAPRAPGELAQALVELCVDAAARRHFGALGLDAWRTRFTPEVVAGRHDALYAELC